MSIILKKFIVLEGIDGAGKTTQINAVTQHFITLGKKVYHTREPHKGLVGTFIRDILNNHMHDMESPYDTSLSSNILAYLFAADRHEHIYAKDGIIAQLDSHDFVICDRYFFSSLAYQGDKTTQSLSHQLNSSFPLPELLIYLDINPQVSMLRMQDKKKDGLETIHNLQAVYDRYAQVLHQYHTHEPNMQIRHIDANQPHTKITQDIISTISALKWS